MGRERRYVINLSATKPSAHFFHLTKFEVILKGTIGKRALVFLIICALFLRSATETDELPVIDECIRIVGKLSAHRDSKTS